MDQYLMPNASFKRLYEEYKKYGSLVIACDFDHTIFDFHEVGATHNMVITLLKDLIELNCKVIIWTGNVNEKLVNDYCVSHGLAIYGINVNSDVSEKYYGKLGHVPPRKLFANVYLDDRAALHSIYAELELLVWLIKKERNNVFG